MKDFTGKWGYSLKQILSMPREKFSSYFGKRFLDMEYCEFRRIIKKETPNKVSYNGNNQYVSWRMDRSVNIVEYKSQQSGCWDEVSEFI